SISRPRGELGRRGYALSRRRAEAVSRLVAPVEVHDEQEHPADQWNQPDQDPPTGAVRVVKPPDRYRDAWKQECQPYTQEGDAGGAEPLQGEIGCDVNQPPKQDPPPKGAPRRPTAELGVVAESIFDGVGERHESAGSISGGKGGCQPRTWRL